MNEHIVNLSVTVVASEMDGTWEQSAEIMLERVLEALNAAGIVAQIDIA